MTNRLRQFSLEDADVCGAICYEAFKQIDEAHGFEASFESGPEAARIMQTRTEQGFLGVVAEQDGRIAGSNFMDRRDSIGGIGPISVDFQAQNSTLGRQMMQWVMDRGTEAGLAGMRLTQAGYHLRSLSLYAKMGFIVREHLAVMACQPLNATMDGFTVRPAIEADLDACGKVCFDVHGFERRGELTPAINRGWATVVEREGRITGYTSNSRYGHTVAETNADVKALIIGISQTPSSGFQVPTRNGELFRWCLDQGLRVVRPMTLMSFGLYNEPAGAFLPSFLY